MNQLDQIASILNIPELKTPHKNSVMKPKDPSMTQQEQDFETSREVLLNVLDVGSKHLEDVIMTAGSYQKPSGWEALAIFMKTMSEIAKDLKGLHDEDNKETRQPHETQSINVQNAVFVGTTTQLLNEIRKQKEIPIDLDIID